MLYRNILIGYAVGFVVVGVLGTLFGSFIKDEWWTMYDETASRAVWLWLASLGIIWRVVK